ncbi:MAG: hypothetical protein MR902_05655 [Campylobacter sp.]|nr:hypothetical protein [Campylobacter sp.]
MSKFKKLAINSIKNSNFKDAKTFISLGASEFSQDELLFFTNLCQVFEYHPFKARAIFNKFQSAKTPNLKALNAELDELNSLDLEVEFENGNFIEFGDLKVMSTKGDLKHHIQSIMFSSKLVLKNKDELMDFIELLLENDMREFAMNYVEVASEFYSYDARFDEIIKRLSNENTITR